MTTEEKVIGIVSEQLGVPKEEVSRASSFVDDLKADSLDVVELVMEFEDEFGIQIPDEDYDKIKTVGDAIDYIEAKSLTSSGAVATSGSRSSCVFRMDPVLKVPGLSLPVVRRERAGPSFVPCRFVSLMTASGI